MPVTKFRTLDEASRALWLKPGTPELARAVAWVWAFSASLAGNPVYPRGVRKFRTIEDANADRNRWEIEYSRALREKRRSPPPAR